MSPSALTVSKSLLRYVQISSSGPERAVLDELVEEAGQLLDIRTWKQRLAKGDFFALFHPWAEESRSIASLLAESDHVWLMAATLGPGLESRSRWYLDHDEYCRGYVLDRLGSFLVEQEMKKLDHGIRRSAEVAGHGTTHRYSPGYGDFSLEAQRVFHGLLNDSITGLFLDVGGLFRPEKTVTALKGELGRGPSWRAE
ncbi:MAG: hypothetical protein RBR38_05085 [Desulfomicrobium apsheronum]|nr:hypothetical protein [Desulfomicrobium apsheronum]